MEYLGFIIFMAIASVFLIGLVGDKNIVLFHQHGSLSAYPMYLKTIWTRIKIHLIRIKIG
jgi:hypothetical protein